MSDPKKPERPPVTPPPRRDDGARRDYREHPKEEHGGRERIPLSDDGPFTTTSGPRQESDEDD